MLDVFKGVVTFFRRRGACTDSVVFRLHYHATVAILLVFCLIVALNQYVRSPIICNAQDIPRDILDAYCWTHSTNIEAVKKTFVVHPGVGTKPKDSDVTTQHYYQWVFLCLLLQAILFYIPKWFWKNWEGGKLKALRMDLDIGFISDTEKSDKKNLLLDYLRHNRGNNTWWTYRYFLCELLALINVFGQIFLMDKFLDGAFWSYGLNFLSNMEMDEEKRTDPLIIMFPHVAKCTFHRYGASGVLQRHDSICVLPLNILNEKIYVFLWFWFVLLLILTALWIVFRIATILNLKVRYYIMILRFRRVQKQIIHKFVSDTEIGDWYLMYMLGENLDNLIFQDILQKFAEKYGPLTDSKLELTEVL